MLAKSTSEAATRSNATSSDRLGRHMKKTTAVVSLFRNGGVLLGDMASTAAPGGNRFSWLVPLLVVFPKAEARLRCW
jgi:hypothetical protein